MMHYQYIQLQYKMKSTQVKQIGNYRYFLDRQLGEGATGTVYQGENLNNPANGPVAVKVIDMKLIDNEVTRYLLECEKEALTTICHSNVLKAEKIIQERDNCYIVSRLCEGKSLKELIKHRKKLSEKEAMSFFEQIVRGYQAIKNKGFLHRDLKSANVMLSGGEPIIIDFGYCEKLRGVKPTAFYNVGSPSYMPPEAYFDTRYSEKSDIWSIGVILYEMIEGHTPDSGQNIHRYFKGLMRSGYTLTSPVSEGFRLLLSKCLEIDANRRADTETLLHIIQQLPTSIPQYRNYPSNDKLQQNIVPKISLKQCQRNESTQNKMRSYFICHHPKSGESIYNGSMKQHSLQIPCQGNMIKMAESILHKPVSAPPYNNLSNYSMQTQKSVTPLIHNQVQTNGHQHSYNSYTNNHQAYGFTKNNANQVININGVRTSIPQSQTPKRVVNVKFSNSFHQNDYKVPVSNQMPKRKPMVSQSLIVPPSVQHQGRDIHPVQSKRQFGKGIQKTNSQIVYIKDDRQQTKINAPDSAVYPTLIRNPENRPREPACFPIRQMTTQFVPQQTKAMIVNNIKHMPSNKEYHVNSQNRQIDHTHNVPYAFIKKNYPYVASSEQPIMPINSTRAPRQFFEPTKQAQRIILNTNPIDHSLQINYRPVRPQSQQIKISY